MADSISTVQQLPALKEDFQCVLENVGYSVESLDGKRGRPDPTAEAVRLALIKYFGRVFFKEVIVLLARTGYKP